MAIAGALLAAFKRDRRVQVPHLEGPVRAHVAAELIGKGRRPILFGRDDDDAERLFRDLSFLLGMSEDDAAEEGVLLVSADAHTPYEEASPDGRAVMERLAALYRLAREPDSVRAVVVAPRVLVRRLVPEAFFERAQFVLAGVELDRESFLKGLTISGYNAVTSVEDPGTFSVRGGIIDVFSPYSSRPYRIDLFGDEVDTIHRFDPTSHKNLDTVEEAIVLPAREIALGPDEIDHALERIETVAETSTVPSRRLRAVREDIENQVHFFGIETLLPVFHRTGLVSADAYLTGLPDAVVLGLDEALTEAVNEDAWTEAQLEHDRAQHAHRLVLPPKAHLTNAEETAEKVTGERPLVEFPEIELAGAPKVAVRFDPIEHLRSEILRATRKPGHDDVMGPLIQRLREWRSRGKTTLIVCQTRGQAERLRAMLENKNVQVRMTGERFEIPAFFRRIEDRVERAPFRDPSVHAFITLGDISGGYVLEDGPLVVVSEEQIFGQRTRRKRKRSTPTGEFVSDLKDLREGDYVVHVDYGIGEYHGLTRLAVNGVEADYLHIEYKGKDRLYLPVHRLKLVQKFVSPTEGGRKPVLDRLGGVAWAKTKAKVKDTLLKMAAELLRLYALRASLEGHAFPAPSETYRQFEAEFAFEPTPDQQRAIDDVLTDLQKPTPMDRLVCGDVGYGKTEVAMRGAMMALEAGQQVAVLVPTTVLAAQHFQTFQERFKNFGARVRIVSRFQTNQEIKQTLAEVKTGNVDIVIGTHKLLGKDVQFERLGLLVIDEEHRFGVSHKEKLKKYRAKVHVLSMSATPIPRTLHMGFMGVRDLSVIATAPQDRLAVKTEVHKFSEDVVRDAILQEIRRGGQCFVVHNRVSSIDAMARFLERLVPEARVVVGHGQMDEARLEKVMVDFMNHEYNVLLSTTIVESGLDIPNANTMIVNRADAMGLAQLYQLKGRVGRGRRRGFAHFLIPAGTLTPKARKRIGVLQRFTELGAGFKVASSDMEIRGAGNILGKQQSGTISQVGFDMYQALLKESIAELQGAAKKSLKEPEIQVPVPTLIPDAYVPEPGERLAFYQRLNSAETDEETFDLLQEISDMFGNPPAEVENLVQLMLVKQRLSRVGSLNLDYGPQTKTMPARLVLRFDADDRVVDPDQLVRFVQADAARRKLTPEGRLVLHLEPFEEIAEILVQAKDLLDALILTRLRAAS